MLNPTDYAKLIEIAPVLCVDIILRTPEGKYLLFKRENEPLKGEWWVIGGRVQKGEKIRDAVRRKIKEEVGIEVTEYPGRDITPTFAGGWYEDQFQFSSIGRGEYHTVSLIFEETIDPKEIKLDAQHSEFKAIDELPLTFKVKK